MPSLKKLKLYHDFLSLFTFNILKVSHTVHFGLHKMKETHRDSFVYFFICVHHLKRETAT